MNLSPLERRILVAYDEHHRRGMTVAGMYRGVGRRLVVSLVLVAVLIALAFTYSETWVATLVLGMVVGAALRDLRTVLNNFKVWPLLDRITDWARVDELLEADRQARGQA